MGSTIGHRIDYNGVGALRGQRHIPSKNLTQVTPSGAPRFRWNHNSFPGKLHGISVNPNEWIFFRHPKSKWLVKRIVPLFLTPQFFLLKIQKQTRILLFYLKNMKYSAALPMFLIWRENLLSYDNMLVSFFRTLRRSKGCDLSWKKIHKILLEFV